LGKLETGFPEFTAKLVKDVFDALLGATLRQMEAYSELVAATAKTLQEYVDENKNLVSGEEVWDWLVKNLPGPAASVTDPKPEDATLVRVGVTLNDSEKDKVRQKTGLPSSGSDAWNPTSALQPADVDTVTSKVREAPKRASVPSPSARADVDTVTSKVRESIAGNRYTLLKEMVKMGIIRLVVDYGEIGTKLTFTTYGQSEALRTASTYNTKAFNITGTLQTGKAINKWVKVSAAANYSSLSVRTTSSIDRDVSGSKADICARVYIRFKSDYQALGG
jgi:hypothetical protein